jgi:RimJ/RimL family protein N-acetyltransferase
MQNLLETERLILKPSSIDDLEKYLEMDMEPEVTKYISGVWDGSEAHISFLKESILMSYGNGLGYWSIFMKNSSLLFLGWILLAPYDANKPEIEIGWRLNRLAWNKGYATEAAKAVTTYAFKNIGLEQIFAYIDFKNNSSIKVAKKLGFRLFSDFVYDGVPCNAYRITRQEYLQYENKSNK